MAAITQRLIRLRPVNGNHPHHLRLFSSSSDNGPPSDSQPEPESQPSFSSYLRDVKSSLQNEPSPQNRPPTLRKPPSPYNPSPPPPPPPPQTHPPSRLAYLEEIRRNLSGFRNRSAPAPPPSVASLQEPTPPAPVASSGESVSLQELYNRHTSPNNENSPSDADGLKQRVAPTFGSIRESLRHISIPSARNQNDSQSKTTDLSSLTKFSQNLKNADGGGGLHSVFQDEVNQNGDGNVDSTPSMRTQLVKMYNYSELGDRLILLRPEKKKGNWFSLHELNERLANLKKIEEKEIKAKPRNTGVMDFMKDTLKKLSNDSPQTQKKRNAPKIDILGQIGGTPSFMLSPPKDHLVEKYFHPDNMSSAEKLKLELKKVRDEFKMSESDCGSARVQVAQLSTKIKHLSTVLKKKDKHSRRGLEAMLDRRRKLLKYLRRTDWDSYCLVLSKFGIRDNNPDIKPAHKNKA